MPQFILVTPIVVEYCDLIEAESLEEAEKGNYTVISDPPPDFTNEQLKFSGFYKPFIEEIEE